MNPNIENLYFPGAICLIESVFLHDPIHEAFALAEDRFDQRCLPSEVVTNREDEEARVQRGKTRPCVVLNRNPIDGSCSVALFYTIGGRDIDEMPLYHRCYSLAVYPTTRIPSRPEGDYALVFDGTPLHTKPEWMLPPRDNKPTEFKDQWVLALPLQLTKKDIGKLSSFQRKCDGGNVIVELEELARFRKICRIAREFFLEQFQTPGALALASTSFMTDIDNQSRRWLPRSPLTSTQADPPPSTEENQPSPAQVNLSPSMVDSMPSAQIDPLPPTEDDGPSSTENDQLFPAQVDLSPSMVYPTPSIQVDSLPFPQDELPPSRDDSLPFPQDNSPQNDPVLSTQDPPFSVQDDPLPFAQGDIDSVPSTENDPIPSAQDSLPHSIQENLPSSIHQPSNQSDHPPATHGNLLSFASTGRNTLVNLFRSWLPWT